MNTNHSSYEKSVRLSGRFRQYRCIGLAEIHIWTRMATMQTIPVSTVKAKLNEYIDAVSRTREQVTITRNGSPAAVLIGVDEWEALQETLFWLSQPGIRETISEAEEDIAAGRALDEAAIRAQFSVPRSH